MAEPLITAWIVFPSRRASLSRRKVLAIVIGGTVAVLILVAVSGSVAAQRMAAKESVYDAARSTGVLADAVVQPALRDDLASGDPAAFAAMDRVVRDHVLGPAIIRVKIWTPDGRIVYSDEPRLIGRRYPLGAEERDVFTHPATRGEVSDLSRPENTFERGKGKLLEVYRPVWTPSGDPLLMEVYAPYDGVTARASQLWRAFAGITVSSLLALVAHDLRNYLATILASAEVLAADGSRRSERPLGALTPR